MFLFHHDCTWIIYKVTGNLSLYCMSRSFNDIHPIIRITCWHIYIYVHARIRYITIVFKKLSPVSSDLTNINVSILNTHLNRSRGETAYLVHRDSIRIATRNSSSPSMDFNRSNLCEHFDMLSTHIGMIMWAQYAIIHPWFILAQWSSLEAAIDVHVELGRYIYTLYIVMKFIF